MKLLLTDTKALKATGDLSLDAFSRFGHVCVYDNITTNTLLDEVADTDIILCNKTAIDRTVIDTAKQLKYIGVFATGFNNIDTVYARKKGITVCNAGSYSTDAVAQQVFAYILAHYSRVREYDSFVKDGGWTASGIFSPLVIGTDEISGKTLGIVGYGSIGRAVEKIAVAFGMKVLIHTRTVRENGISEFVTLERLLTDSDIITVHCPLNSESENMFRAEAFNKMKNGAFFINTSRGGVVDEQALYDALESGKLSGAAVDVLCEEPMSQNCPLKSAQNIIITPHTAWGPLAARQRLVSIVTTNIDAFLSGKPQNVVN